MPFVRDNEPIKQWQEGDFARGFALLSRKDMRVDRNGREYLDLELTDASGAIPAKVWPETAAVRGDYQARDFVAFKGTVHLYRDQLQLNVDHCRRVDPRDNEQGFDPGRLIPTTPEGIEPLWRRLEAIFPPALRRPVLRRVVEIALERFGEGLREHAAAKSIHHAYRGGLLEHTVTMAELGIDVCARYRDVDRDVVLVGVLFHDIGKLEELAPVPSSDYTLRGHLVGHVVLGRDMLLACCQAAEVPAALALHLEHLVLSHQGRRAYGSPVEPNTPEAFVLHAIDDLDAKLNHLRAARRDGPDTQFLRGLDRHVYVAAPPDRALVERPDTDLAVETPVAVEAVAAGDRPCST